MQIKYFVVSLVMAMSLSINTQAQMPVSPGPDSPDSLVPVEPFHIIGNIYYIGTTAQSTSYLITSPEGHIVIDSMFEKSVPTMIEHVKKLGFKPSDIKYILTVHAHVDHVGGHALLQEETGAKIMVMAEDASIVETGGKTDPGVKPESYWTPAKVDKQLKDGEQVTLGGTTLTAHLTPGHTQGCTTWTTVAEEEGKKYNVVFMCGVRIDGPSLLSDPDYPDVATDLAGSYKVLESLPVDVYLGGHGYWFNLTEKIKRMKAGEGYKAFIDPEGYRRAINGWQNDFIDKLIKEAKAK